MTTITRPPRTRCYYDPDRRVYVVPGDDGTEAEYETLGAAHWAENHPGEPYPSAMDMAGDLLAARALAAGKAPAEGQPRHFDGQFRHGRMED